MHNSSNKKHVDEIDFYDFTISRNPMISSPIILFIDDNGKTKVLKNGYGYSGNINSN